MKKTAVAASTLLLFVGMMLAVVQSVHTVQHKRGHDSSLVEVSDQMALQNGLQVPPFEELPSMAALDGLDKNLVNPLANPRTFPGKFQSLNDIESRLNAIPSPNDILGPTTTLMTPSSGLPPLVSGVTPPEALGVTPPMFKRLPPVDTIVNQPSKFNSGLPPPNPKWTDPVANVNSPSQYLDLHTQKQQLGTVRNQFLQRMQARLARINHFKAYVDGGDAWITKMEDQLEKWLAQERARGSKSIVAEKKQVESYKKVLGQLMAQQQNDAKQVNIINTEMRKLETQYKLEEQKKRLQSTMAEQQQLEAQLKQSGSRKSQMEKELKDLNEQLKKIKAGADKVAGGAPGDKSSAKGAKSGGSKASSKSS